ncbi:unnamed protein product [Toxocara canis]|uniref:WD_REPEATS_REGION domain-containing protein n=1 Tax=Toxocara canis TaxID=6265 RepID=A0A183VGX3_TOXCA|nr:unnamed protein product [Toxocara canis]
MVRVSTTFIAKGCERRPNVVACSKRVAVLAFASAGDICIAQLPVYFVEHDAYVFEARSPSRIVSTNVAHERSITCLKFVKWIDEPSGYRDIDYVIAGSADGLISVWTVATDETTTAQCSLFSKHLAKGGSAITYCAGAVQSEVSTSSTSSLMTAYSVPDGTVHVRWKDLKESSLEVDENEAAISFAPDFALCFDFHLISSG